METSPTSASHQLTLRRNLERALSESTEPEVRFHIRQALQMVV
jgi:hypothetical protein